MRIRQVDNKFSQLPASSGASGAETAATILRQVGITSGRSNKSAPAMFAPFEKPTAIVCSTFGGCGWLYAEPKLVGPRAVIGCPAAVID